LFAGCADPQPEPHGSVVALSADARGLPRMLQAHDLAPAPAPTAMQSARMFVERLAGTWGVAPGTLPALVEVGEVAVRGGTIARIRQVIDGLPVWGRELRVLVKPGGALGTVSGTLLGTLAPRTAVHFAQDEAGAIARAVAHTYGGHAGVVVERAQAKRVWYPQADRLVAAWVVDAYTSMPGSTFGDANRTIIAGADGRVLDHYSLVADAFSYRVFAETTGELHPLDGPTEDATPHPTGTPNGFYPAYITPSLVTVDSLNQPGDPWLPPTATETSGNNVDAYVDIEEPNGLSGSDFRATLTGPLAFDRTYDTSQGPLVSTSQQMAAITSLFYVINWLHDFWYDAGFTEVAGNGQAVNYGRGGVEGDPLLAEAQDNANGGSRNNANMATPDDGMSPRMQVYLWSGKDERSLALLPSNRMPAVGGAVFGPKDFDLTGALVVGSDGMGANPTDGCTALTNTVTGKIVVVDRGNCSFKTKALNIQNAGGIGMLLVNNQASASPPAMGDDANLTATITIPSLSVTDIEGALIKSEIGNGVVTATMHRRQFQELDGSLDSTLIAHEFGHYLHHRLSLCENKMCRAMSEGWGDFTALLLLARAGDNLDGAFPFSIYTTQSFSADPAYFGIRRAPYSVDMNINSLSFRHMADGEPLPANHPFNPSNTNSEVHNAGEVWAAALWEAYVALQKAGTSFDEVRQKMAQYVVAGLLLAPNEASPMETRNALLAAALAASPADHDVMMAAFARRGFGSCAVPPPPDSLDFVGLVESHEVAGNPGIVAFSLADNCDGDGVLDSGETAKLSIRVGNQGHAPLTDVQLAVTSALPGVTVVSPPTAIAQLDRFATTDIEVEVKLDGATAPVAGDLALTITATGGCAPTVSIPVAFRLNIDDRPETSAIDTFDTENSLWQPWTAAWRHIRESALDGAWHGDDLASGTDTRLTSPLLEASDSEPLVISFQHAYSFEADNGTNYDGGVIEYSIDDGVTWEDVSTLTTPGYTGVLTADSGNELGGRMAYTGNNPAWPGTDTVTLDFGTALAGKAFRIRFRIATDAGTGAPGWTVDEVAFSGIVGTPFPTQVADDGVCGPDVPPDDPITSGGGGCCDARPLRKSSIVLALSVLGLVVRRRRWRQ
jgi:hypothetical protein